MDGIIILNKPKGFTSHDCVAKLRGILKTKKIGHTGTLDPDVTGVLPICVGKATKLSQFMIEKDKEYICKIIIGTSTKTEDITGEVLQDINVEENISKDNILDVLNSFKGTTNQKVPMYSSVKVNGKKLHQYAREDVYIKDRPIREINTKHIELLSDIEHKDGKIFFDFKVLVSKGTYVRTICKDIGKKLGLPACMYALVRTKSGNFYIEDSVTFEDIESNNYNFLPIHHGLTYEKLTLTDQDIISKVKNGMTIPITTNIENETVQVFDDSNNFLAIYKISDKNNSYLKPVKVVSN